MPNPLKYLTDPNTGCCKTSELMEMSRDDKKNNTHHVEDLKAYAREEMKNKGIPTE
jgi:hypothetical protein